MKATQTSNLQRAERWVKNSARAAYKQMTFDNALRAVALAGAIPVLGQAAGAVRAGLAAGNVAQLAGGVAQGVGALAAAQPQGGRAQGAGGLATGHPLRTRRVPTFKIPPPPPGEWN